HQYVSIRTHGFTYSIYKQNLTMAPPLISPLNNEGTRGFTTTLHTPGHPSLVRLSLPRALAHTHTHTHTLTV
ncbi:MAG: hypothetical protein ACPIOQ_79775, partial [Promethearchaeia archaeon]